MIGLHPFGRVHGITNTWCPTEDFLRARRRLAHLFRSHPAVHRAWEFIAILYNNWRNFKYLFYPNDSVTFFFFFFHVCAGWLLTERPNSHVVNCYVSVELLPTELSQASWEPSVPKTGKNSEPVSCENHSKPTSHVLGNLTKSTNYIHNNRKTSRASLSWEAIYSGAKKEVVNRIFHNKLQWGTCEWTIKMAIIWAHEGRIRDYVFIVPLVMQ